jgi:hypothetical protein
MYCAQCSEKFQGKPIRQGNDFFCSLECANLASGLVPEEETDGYFEEESLEGFSEEYD